MKILLFGGRGYIGSEFVNQLKQIEKVILTMIPSRHYTEGKSYTFKQLENIIKDIKPDVIINCSAYIGGTSIVNCEHNKGQTIQSNVIFPKMLAEICYYNNIILGHMSSGCVYDGYVPGGFKEHDERNLTFNSVCSFYTGTKALAEDYLDVLHEKYIWRIRLPFDEYNNPRNYISKLMSFDKLLVAENSISNRKELVKSCIDCILKEISFGTYHLTNPGHIRSDEIVKMVKDILMVSKEFKYFDSFDEFDKIRKIPTSNTILNTDKLKDVGIIMTHVHESVERSLKNWVWS